jgi:hypothetical protein
MPQPVTAREFADARREVHLTCEACGHAQTLDLETIVFMLGEYFPLATTPAALSAEIHCGACGAPRPTVSWKPVDLEDAETFIRERPSRQKAG